VNAHVKLTWLAEGRAFRHLLPWEKERATREKELAVYAARPHCYAEREWARLAVRSLAERLTDVADEVPVEFWFDGEVLTIRWADERLALAAKGERWPTGYSLPARSLRADPKRFKDQQVEFSVWKGALVIGRQRYEGVAELTMNTPGSAPGS
jgi:hypothetical protein